jgi:Tfp pilus assembly pilus retraction ATPase PilT
MDIHELLKKSADLGASDLHVTVGIPRRPASTEG